MPGFYYYLPKITKERLVRGELFDREVLAAVGLDAVLADVTHAPKHAACSNVSANGPDGSSGCILSIQTKREKLPKIGNWPDRQTWLPVGDGSKAWLGWFNESPPDPTSLERWNTVPGYLVTDPKTFEWSVPVARSPVAGFQHGTLPQSYLFDGEGEPQGVLQPSYAWLWELAGEIRQWYAADIEPREDATPVEVEGYTKPPFAWLVKAAQKILGVNYRVGPAELNALHALGHEVLTQASVHSICQAAIDFELVAAAKKKLPADTSLTPES